MSKQQSPSALWRSARLAVLLLVIALTSNAQYSSNVQGTVSDPNGGLIPAAAVVLQNKETGVQYKTETDAAGFYRFTSIAPGAYSIIVEAAGFSRNKTEVAVTTGQTVGVKVSLTLAQAAESIIVTGEAPALNPDETRLQVTLGSRELSELPLQSRGTLNIVKAAPGVNGIFEAQENIPIGKNKPDARANGRPSASNLFLLDGTPLMSTTETGALVITPNADMLSEVALQTTSFGVDNGAGSSMQVEFTTKSGSNDYHGSFDFSYTNKTLSSRPFFGSALAPFSRKYTGGSIGGPVIKDKTFFFGALQNTNKASSTSSLGTWETPEFVDWAKRTFPNSLSVRSLLDPFRATRTERSRVTQYARDVFGATSCGTAAAFNIPCDLPVQFEGLFTQSPKVSGTQYNVRLDHYMREAKDRLYVQWFTVDQMSDYLDARPNWDSKTPSTSYYAGLNYTHVFTPTLMNQLSLGATRYWGGFGGAGNLEFVKVPAGVTVCCQQGWYGWFPPFAPNVDREHTQQLRNYMSWLKGTHTLKFGFQAGRRDFWQDRAGIYSRPFNMNYNSWFDFFQDKTSRMSLYTISAQTGQWLGQYFGAKVNTFGGYVQDEWKVRPNLLLTLGIRWDDFGNPSEYGAHAQDYAAVFPGSGSNFGDQIANTSVKLVDNAFAKRMNGNFMPRAGFAWTPQFDSKLSVRGGLGLYLDAISLSTVTANLPTQPPNRLTLDLSEFSPNLPAPYAAFGTTTAGPPWGYSYPPVTVRGFTDRGAAIGYAASLNGIDYNLRPQKSYVWSLALEREIAHRTVVGLTYTGSHSWDQIYNADFNTLAGDLIDGRMNRRTDAFGGIQYYRNGLEANYNALVFTARQTAGPLSWQASYTFSRTLSDPLTSAGVNDAIRTNERFPDPYNPTNFYGPASYDIPHRATFSLVYQLPSPSKSGWLKQVAGGWTLSSMFVGQSGSPFTVFTDAGFSSGGDYNADGINWDVPNLGSVNPAATYNKQQLLTGVFKVADFVVPAGYKTAPVQGAQGRNMFRNPNYMSLDGSLVKAVTLPWRDSMKLSFRLEGFNVLNRVNLGEVKNNLRDTQFGRVTTTNNPRILQLGMRFEF
jgi:hypothetical protein